MIAPITQPKAVSCQPKPAVNTADTPAAAAKQLASRRISMFYPVYCIFLSNSI